MTSPSGRRGVKRLLAVFAVISAAGVLMLAFSVVIGLFLLVLAEAFFVAAYRKFRRSQSGK